MKPRDPRKELLKIILKFEKKEAEWGVKASKAKMEYCKFSPFKEKDKVKYKERYYSSCRERCGIIHRVYFDTHRGFRYWIIPTNKNYQPIKNRDYIWVNSIGDRKGIIKATDGKIN